MDDQTEIKVTLARMEEQQKASVHRLKNVDMKMDALAAKVDGLPSIRDMERLETRVAVIEKAQSWIVRGALFGSAGAGGAVYFIGKKLGF